MRDQLEMILNDSPLFLAIVGPEMAVITLSQAWQKKVNGDQTVTDLCDLFAESSCAAIRQQVADVLATKTFIQDLEVSLATTTDEEGLLTIWPSELSKSGSVAVLSFTFASAFARTREELQQLQQKHELILNAAGEGVYGLDHLGRMTFANQASSEILGWSITECLGKSAHEVHHHSHEDGSEYKREDCPIYAAFKDGEVHRVDCEVFWHADGRAIPVEYTSTPIIEDGKPNGAVVIFRDISDRFEARKLQEEAYREIKELKDQLELERDYLRDEIKVTVNFGEIIGNSPALKRTLEQVEAVAQSDANVLVLGESGVGKELIARAIHRSSSRSDRPLVKVNCASIPKELFESEFFGHVKGSFTGAYKDRVGRLQLADGGTLFLDEVGEIPMPLQSKLLRALQEREFERVGDDQTISVDLRVVAATNRDLEAEIEAGRFREDLYYRLSVFPISVPPLRDRTEDILPLTQHLLEGICRSMGKEPLTLSRQQSEMLQSLSWPGNIRELRNVLERAVILSKGTRLRLDLSLPGLSSQGLQESTRESNAESEQETRDEFISDAEFRLKEKQNLEAALEHADWRISGQAGAADLLGIKPSTLAYRMKALNIKKPPA